MFTLKNLNNKQSFQQTNKMLQNILCEICSVIQHFQIKYYTIHFINETLLKLIDLIFFK